MSRLSELLLYRNDAGDVKIRWQILAWSSAAYVLAATISHAIFRKAFGVRFTAASAATSLVVYAFVIVVWLNFVRCRAEKRSVKQFSLSALLACLTVACCLLALMVLDRRSGLENSNKRILLQQSIMSLVGGGTVNINDATFIQVKRLSFDDDDLKKVLGLKPELDQVGSPLTFLDLSGTSVTDRGVGELATADSLQYCFLDRTAITDTAVSAFTRLTDLKVLSVWSTSVTAERLLTLSTKRPKLDIEPKDYQRLKAP